MTQPLPDLDALRRPRLLVRTARFGLEDYRRERDLPRLLPGAGLPGPARALDLLLAEEAACEAARQRGDATWSVTRQIDLLIAILGEAQLAAAAAAPAPSAAGAAPPPPQAKASGISALRRAT